MNRAPFLAAFLYVALVRFPGRRVDVVRRP